MHKGRTLRTLAATAFVLAACGGTADAPGADPSETSQPEAPDPGPGEHDALRVAFVHVEPVGDSASTTRHEIGREHLEQALGDSVTTAVVDGVGEGADSEAVFEELAAQGHDLIFGTSHGYGDAMLAVSARHPDVVFQHAGGSRTTDNLGTYTGAAEQTRFLEGLAAGAASETGLIGFVAPFPIPEVVRGINAYTLGARAAHPDAQVQLAWTSTWFDPDVETDAARSLVDAGADVIGMHQSSAATGEVAAAAGASWTGFHADLSSAAPDAWLTATVWNFGEYYASVARSVLDGTWEATDHVGDLADGMLELAPLGPSVDDATREHIEARRAELAEGSFAVFTGPIVDASGTLRAAPDEVLDPEQVRAMDWFVTGVLDDVV